MPCHAWGPRTTPAGTSSGVASAWCARGGYQVGRDMSDRDGHPVLHPTRIDIPPEIRLYLITLLNQTLACTVDLRSQVKQASWNVKGQRFLPVAGPLRHHRHRTRRLRRPDGRTPRRCSAGWHWERRAPRPRNPRCRSIPVTSRQGTRMCWRWRSASRPTPRRCGTPLRTPRMSAMRIRRPSTPTSRAGSINGCRFLEAHLHQ